MRLAKRPIRLPGRQRLPRRTVRLRLTLLYGGLFLLCGAGLLAVTYLLVKHAGDDAVAITRSTGGGTVTVEGGSGSKGPTLTLHASGRAAGDSLSTPPGAGGAGGATESGGPGIVLSSPAQSRREDPCRRSCRPRRASCVGSPSSSTTPNCTSCSCSRGSRSR